MGKHPSTTAKRSAYNLRAIKDSSLRVSILELEKKAPTPNCRIRIHETRLEAYCRCVPTRIPTDEPVEWSLSKAVYFSPGG